MASNGLQREAKTGKCRMCQYVRRRDQLKIVGEVTHGFATGHIWECEDVDKCDAAMAKNIATGRKAALTEIAMRQGRWVEYRIVKYR